LALFVLLVFIPVFPSFRPPFTGASIRSFALRLTPPLNLPALGRRQPPYVVFTTLRRPVFLVNSRLGHFSATLFLVNKAILLPKLRIHFAEFLNESSHKRLRILTPPTCVGLRYGLIACIAEREFSWQLGSATFFGFNPYFRPYLYPYVARIFQSDGLW